MANCSVHPDGWHHLAQCADGVCQTGAVHVRPSSLTIDQWEFCSPASFEFNAWGGRACWRGSLVPVPVPRPPPSSPLPHPSLSSGGPSPDRSGGAPVCLPLHTDNHSALTGPSAFKWIIVYTGSIIGGCRNGELLKGRLRKMGSDCQSLIFFLSAFVPIIKPEQTLSRLSCLATVFAKEFW